MFMILGKWFLYFQRHLFDTCAKKCFGKKVYVKFSKLIYLVGVRKWWCIISKTFYALAAILPSSLFFCFHQCIHVSLYLRSDLRSKWLWEGDSACQLLPGHPQVREDKNSPEKSANLMTLMARCSPSGFYPSGGLLKVRSSCPGPELWIWIIFSGLPKKLCILGPLFSLLDHDLWP